MTQCLETEHCTHYNQVASNNLHWLHNQKAQHSFNVQASWLHMHFMLLWKGQEAFTMHKYLSQGSVLIWKTRRSLHSNKWWCIVKKPTLCLYWETQDMEDSLGKPVWCLFTKTLWKLPYFIYFFPERLCWLRRTLLAKVNVISFQWMSGFDQVVVSLYSCRETDICLIQSVLIRHQLSECLWCSYEAVRRKSLNTVFSLFTTYRFIYSLFIT